MRPMGCLRGVNPLRNMMAVKRACCCERKPCALVDESWCLMFEGWAPYHVPFCRVCTGSFFVKWNGFHPQQTLLARIGVIRLLI